MYEKLFVHMPLRESVFVILSLTVNNKDQVAVGSVINALRSGATNV